MQNFDAVVDAVLTEARAHGLEAEAFVQGSSATRIQVLKGEVEQFSLAETTGLSVRVIRDGQMGYAYTERLTPDRARATLHEAAENARLLPASEHVALAEEGAAPPELTLFSPALEEIPVDEKITWALALEQTCFEADARVKNVTHASFADSRALLRVASTRGLDRSYLANMAWIGCQALVASEGDHAQNKSHYEAKASRQLVDLDPERVARKAVREAIRKLDAREIPSGAYPVVFGREAFADLLATFSGIFSGKLAQEGKSLLAGKLGETVASACFTLTDDALLSEGFAARPFDDEGVSSARHVLITDGVFTTFLHNTETARRAGVPSTAHAARSYRGTLGVSPSNLVVSPGNRGAEELLSAHPRLLHVTEVTGLHAGANPISGDFSLQAQGYLVENGEERHAVHNFTVSGSFLTLLSAIEAVGNDTEVFPGGICVVTPSVLVREMAVAGE